MANSLRASAPHPSPAPRSVIFDRARSVSAGLHSLFKARHQNLAQIAHALAAVKREELFRYLGYASVFAYAWDQHRIGKSKVSELIGISKASDRLPKIREAFDSGRLDWTKARELSKVATPNTEAEWLRKAQSSTADDLRAERKGEPAPRRRVLAFPEEAAAQFDQLVAGIKREIGVVPDWQAVLELMKRGACSERGEAPVQRLVINQCGTCHAATSETREGPVSVSRGAVEHARCGGEVHDLREEDNKVTRAIPAKVRRRVLDRDHARCLVPGCRALSVLDVHHEDGWKQGHDPARMLTLCWSHHRARHEGLLRIEGRAPSFRFVLQGGTVLGESPGAAGVAAGIACENGDRTDTTPPPAKVTASPKERDSVRDATLALQSLGMKVREAKTHVQVALDAGGRRSWTAAGLLRAALVAS